MSARSAWGSALAAFAILLAPAAASAEVRAGAASVDASWHIGASAGQYAGDCVQGDDPSQGCAAIDPANGNYDPTAHSYRRRPSYGIQSRLEVRALVIDDQAGAPTAIVKTDLYIPQDLLYRRAAQLLEASSADCGVTRETLTMTASHNHSSPLYSSTAWGVWAFQDVFDVRFYNYMAERIATAVEKACAGLVPVRVGASVGQFDKTHRHSFGPAVADDGTPAGYPHENTDQDLTVIRFDDISGPTPKPLANLVNFSGHPEFLNGNDLISADYIGPLERMTDRATGALTIWTQGAVGTAEPERSSFHSIHERLEFTHREYAQAEYAGRLLTDAIVGVWGEVGGGGPAVVPFATNFPVQTTDRWYPGPFSHPYPTVSNCRTDKGLDNPTVPVVGLPTCESAGFSLQDGLSDLSDSLGLPVPPPNAPGTDPGLDTDDFQSLGIPVPENYSAPSYTGLQEDIDIHLQGIRLGEIYLPICSCEQWFDQSENIETRTDKLAGNEYLGLDWGEQCMPIPGSGTHVPYTEPGAGTGTWSCPNPGNPAQTLPPVSDLALRKMRAQVLNPANGWNNAENAASAESEPVEATLIKGNYSHDDRCGPTPLTPGDQPCGLGGTSASAALGYDLTVPISMANDYNGYIATYREYQRGDHYRKSLAAWGPHSSDYMSSRLVTIGRQLRNPAVVLPTDQVQEQPLVVKAAADTAVNDQRATALGETGGAAITAYEAGLPDEANAGTPVTQPAHTERFGATTFTWNGGSNFTDNPRVRVERLVAGAWMPYADQSGELPVTLDFPEVANGPAYLAGGQQWPWTAHFEAFVAPFDTGERALATPAGSYRFVVDGERRADGAVVPYRLQSQVFAVRPWSGITAEDFRHDTEGTLSFRVGPRSTYTVGGPQSEVEVEGGPEPVIVAEIGPIDYPDSYDSSTRFIVDRRTAYRDPAARGDASKLEWFCFACSFRPWIDSGDAATAEVTIVDAGGIERVPATRVGDRWITAHTLEPGETAFVEIGGVLDEYGNLNGARSAVVSLDGPALPPPPPPPPPPDPGPTDPAPTDPAEPDGTAAPAEPADSGGSGEPGASDNTPPSGDGGADGLVTGPPAAGPCGRLILGSRGADKLLGTAVDELLKGLRGRDRLNGRGGDDCVRGGADPDRLRGGAGDDSVAGGRGRDRIRAGGGDDLIRVARGRADRVDCGRGSDRVKVGRGDRTRRCERVIRRRSR